MTAKKRNGGIDGPFDGLLGKPALLKSEDSVAYLTLREAFRAEINPKTIFDEITLQDLTDKYWEERRFRRSQAALIDSASVQSLGILCEPFYGDNMEEALATAQDYYSGVTERTRAAQKLMVQLGITPEQIEANAMHVRGLGLEMFDRMINSRETSRNSIIKEHARRQRKAEKAKRRSGTNDNSPAPGAGDAPKKSVV